MLPFLVLFHELFGFSGSLVKRRLEAGLAEDQLERAVCAHGGYQADHGCCHPRQIRGLVLKRVTSGRRRKEEGGTSKTGRVLLATHHLRDKVIP